MAVVRFAVVLFKNFLLALRISTEFQFRPGRLMSISVACEHCKSQFKVNAQHAGKQAKCPKCSGAIRIPTVAPTPSQAVSSIQRAAKQATSLAATKASQQSATKSESARRSSVTNNSNKLEPASDLQTRAKQILGAFQGKVEPTETSQAYKIGTFFVSLLMILLPLIYISIIFLVTYLVFYHAINNIGILSTGRGGRGGFFSLVIYVSPMVIGPIVILFMLKPLFARPGKQPGNRSVTRKQEPLLFAFVDRICEVVDAPKPSRIDLDCQVNASASFRRGLLSMFGNDLVLTIGLPVVAGLTTRQFAGVLAHEFGHFSQGAGMRLTFLIRTISYWFTRVVYERDSWDDWLARNSAIDFSIGWIFYVTRFFVWLTRKILWVLMYIGHAMGGYLLREMEFDADRYEARLAGSSNFETTCRRLQELGYASEKAFADLGDYYREGRLGDDLPRLILSNSRNIPERVQKIIAKHMEKNETSIFDTHPADKDRIVNALAEKSPGVFLLEFPATSLFTKFTALSKSTTHDFYRSVFGKELKQNSIRPIEELLDKLGREEKEDQSLRRFFQGHWQPMRPLDLPGGFYTEPAPAKEIGAKLVAARNKMIATFKVAEDQLEAYNKADSDFVEAEQAESALAAGLRVSATTFNQPLTTKLIASEAKRRARRARETADKLLADFDKAASVRFTAAIELLYTPEIMKTLPKAKAWQTECEGFLSTIHAIQGQLTTLRQWRAEYVRLAILVISLEGNNDNEKLIRSITKRMETMLQLIQQLRSTFLHTEYPFDHIEKDMTLGKYLIPEIPNKDDLGAIYDTGGHCLDACVQLLIRCYGRLAWFVEQVETAAGLKPLPDPPEKDDQEKTDEPKEGDA